MMMEHIDIHLKKMNLDTDLFTSQKLTQMITDLSVKCKAQLLEDNIGENLDDLGFGNNFSDITPRAGYMKEKSGRLTLKLKTSALWKAMLREWIYRLQTGKKAFAEDIPNKELLTKSMVLLCRQDKEHE